MKKVKVIKKTKQVASANKFAKEATSRLKAFTKKAGF